MSATASDLYLQHRTVIETAIRFVCRRRGLRGPDAEDFAQEVRARLVESGGDILNKFQGRSSLPTYLTVVIQRLALDYQAARWGRWRASAVARSGGAHAVRLEQLVVRDGVPLADALTTVEREMGPIDRAALETLAARYPARVRREYVGEELLEAAAADTPSAERLLVAADEQARFERVKARLAELLETLDPAERLMLQLRFEQGMTVAAIARLQDADQKRLYRRIHETLSRLRAILEAEGVDASAMRSMLMTTEAESREEPPPPGRLYQRNTP